MNIKKQNTRQMIIWVYLSIPILSSVISFIHMIKFLSLGNYLWVAILMSITYEIINIFVILAISIMGRLQRTYVWSIFYIVLFTQIFGNIYFIYSYTKYKIDDNSKYISHFSQIIDTIISPIADPLSSNGHVFLLSIIMGLPIPLISLLISKSLQKYLSDENSVNMGEINNSYGITPNQ